MMSPKDKIRANVYKSLLEEEKKRNKKISVLSLSLFVVGVFTGTSHDLLFNPLTNKKIPTLNKATKIAMNGDDAKSLLTIDDMFQSDGINISKQDFNSEKLFTSDIQI